jgi:general secretion pathway protein D
MKTITKTILLASLCAMQGVARAQETNTIPDNKTAPATSNVAGPQTAAPPADPAGTQPAAAPAEAATAPAPAIEPASQATNAPSPSILLPNGEMGIRMNFRNASLDMVLNHLSEAAGFIIVMDAKPTGKVDAWSNTPITKDEAVNLLNSVLNRNGYAAIRNGRTLTIVNKDEAKTRDIPVKLGADPDGIPKTDEIITQIMPIRFVEAAQLLKDIQPLVSSTTTMTANEAGNSIVITDTQANIHRVAEIIKAIDTGAQSETEVRVFRLKFADPVEMAELLGNLFPDDSKSGSSQSPIRFGGGGGRGGGMAGMFGGMFGGGGNNSGGSNQRIQKRARVLAVPDQRTASVIVSAAKELMDQIGAMVEQLDANPAKKRKVYVYSLENADVTEVQQVLSDMFERNSTTSQRNNRNSQQNNALQNRSTQNQMRGNTGSGMNNSAFGSSRGGGGSSGGF